MSTRGFAPIFILLGFLGLIAVVGAFVKVDNLYKAPSPTPASTPEPNYTLDYSEGTCAKDTECKWAGIGCGGGHGKCTNNPEKYKGSVSTCDVNPNFPANKGYTCGCIEDVGKCGWVK